MDGRSRTSGISRLATNPCPLTGGLHVASNNSGVITTMLLGLVLVLSVFALAVAVSLARWVLKQDNGTPEMRRVSDAIKEGAQAFLRRQYRTIGLLSVALAVLIYVLYAFFRRLHPDEVAAGLTPVKLALTTTFSFLFGALCSGVAGVIGMYVAVRANIRTASAARSSLNRALQIALRGGAVSGLFVVAMSLLGVGGLYAVIQSLHLVPITKVPLVIVGYGFGASFVALFAQLGGGIYTKAADVGADLVGKVEAGIPEDDPRNPAVIADLVGDNVGDCAGRGADLFESTAAENIGAMILGAGLATAALRTGVHFAAGMVGVMLFPLVARAFGLIASTVGAMAVRTAASAGPTIVISLAILGSYLLGRATGIPGAGLFGTAVATMGMLATAAYILAMDTFGPITDNAGGIVEMSHQPEDIRKKTDRLDAVGNTTKALTKGYAIGSAALAAFLLFSAYLDEVRNYGFKIETVDIAKPEIFVGGLLGAMLVFLFSALAIRAVSQAAQYVIMEVRRQFKEKPGILAGTERPDYGRCVDIVTRGALRQMVLPGILAVAMPIVTGVVFKAAFHAGAEAVAALLMVGTMAGILMATMLNNGGGAWDNAKKYIETGMYGGKGSDAHKAAVVGDTVGDPFKDTAGPSLHVLIKLLSTITLVMAPLFI